ncbi:MAG: ECF-type sigma factor [Candidatus Eisenbacteria bacterium]
MNEHADPDMGGALAERLYADLRRLAQHRLESERPHHTLQPTALVHEVYLRLEEQRSPFQNREQFLSFAARAMRRVLVDYARKHNAAKRGGGVQHLTLSGLDSAGDAAFAVESEVDPLDLDRSLEKLADLDERQVRIVELRYFAGGTTAEIASALGISTATVEREWRMARAWLRRELMPGGSDA